MNKKLEKRIVAKLDRVHEDTESTYSDSFFGELDAVTNALDNVKARKYIDKRCIKNLVPLLDSGTLGPKGHVQVILPHLTETYGEKDDPEETGDIPHCTLKMFPEETLHCVEWSRDKFGKLFSLRPKRINEIFNNPEFYPEGDQEAKQLTETIKIIKN